MNKNSNVFYVTVVGCHYEAYETDTDFFICSGDTFNECFDLADFIMKDYERLNPPINKPL